MTVKSFDPTLKALVETEPESWPAFFHQPIGPTQVIDARHCHRQRPRIRCSRRRRPPCLLHVEFAAGHDTAMLPSKVHVRNALLEYRHDLRVRSGVVLLSPEADSPQLTGIYERPSPVKSRTWSFAIRWCVCGSCPPSRC